MSYNRLVETRHGTMLANINDRFVGQSLIQYGEFSRQEAALFDILVTPGMTVYEIGANVGAHTVHLARCAGYVVAVEPQRVPFQTLCANLQLNSLDNVSAFWAACGEKVGALRVAELNPREEANFGGLEITKPHPLGSSVVPIMTVDMLAFQVQRGPDVIKIDVEGMELDVLKGAANAIQSFKPILYVENDRQENSDVLIQHLVSLGYELYWHLPPIFTADNFNTNDQDIWPDKYVSQNMICLPPKYPRSAALSEYLTDPVVKELALA